MTTLFELAIETTRLLPPERQDEIARLMLQMAGEEQGVYRLSDDELESLRASREQARKGVFASESEIQSVWERHGA